MTEKLTKVEFSNLDKILYPELKVTKAQVIEYYIKVAPKMLNLLTGRPIVMTRFPNGIDKEGFYEKDAPQGTPPWVKTFKRYSETAEREINYVLCNDLDTLLWLANLASLEIHMTLSKADSFENPDLVVFDLDPKPPADYDDVVEVALLIKEKLDDLSLTSYVKTSGKKGLHIIMPIVNRYTFQQAREFVQKIAANVEKQTEKVVAQRSKSEMPGKVYLDYVQNSHGRTMVCPYSTRATPLATVSTPLEWSDVKKGLNPEEFNLFSVVKISKSPWEGLLENRQKLEAS
ncbi:MAG TPA: non-homologous end-joining DNA ligase [Candidatus Acidoferrales bacterium]|nr:non-homologous end-joining DNA ligase [Candidatus Acidoferrales bacterium]